MSDLVVNTPARASGPSMRVIAGLIIVAVAVVAIFAAKHFQRPAPTAVVPAAGNTVGSDSVAVGNRAQQWDSVKTITAKAAAQHWSDAVPARIVIDESKTSRLGSPLGGRVTAVMVERGEHVKAGAALFSVASPNLAEIRSDRDKALVELATAKTTLERVQALVDAQSLPAKELISAKQNMAEAELAVHLADAKLSSMHVSGTGTASFTVNAPRNGIVVEKNVAVGQEVTPDGASSHMAIADLSDVWVVADLFEDSVGSLKAGAQAKVVIDGVARNVAGHELDGVIDQVSAVVDPDRHTVPVRVKLANADGSLRPNAYAQLRFLDPTPAIVDLPASAVMSDGTTGYVYVQTTPGVFKRRDVVAGAVHDGVVPIFKGIDVGTVVVERGAVLLDNQIQLDN